MSDNQKSVVIISQYFYPDSASTAQLMTDLATGLVEQNYAVKVFTNSYSNNDLTSNLLCHIEIVRSSSLGKHDQSITSKVLNSLLFLLNSCLYVIFRVPRSTPLLIASNPPYAGIIGLFFSLFKRGNYYFLLQDIFPESAVLSGIIKPNGLLFKLCSTLTYLTCKHSQAIIILTSSMKAFLEKKYPNLQAKQNLRVIENWSVEHISPIEKQNNEFAIRYELTKTFTVLYSGNMGRLHDIESIVSASQLLSNQPIKFVFIGDGSKRKILEQSVRDQQLKNLLLLPFQPRKLLSQSLTVCDLSLVSLIEGAEEIIAPCKLYGMLAAGRAILSISSPGSYIDQLLTEYSCGVNCSPHHPQQLADVIAELAVNPERVKAMGRRARQLYEEKYTFSRALDEYENLLSQ